MRGAKQKEMFEISDLRRREILHLRSVCPFIPQWVGGGGTLIFSYIHRLWLFLGVQSFEFRYFGGFSEDFVDIFGGSSQNWTIMRGHFYAF